MKKFTVYEVYIDDNQGDPLKITVPAPNKNEAIEFCSGNGEIIAVRNSDLQDIDTNFLIEVLKKNNYGKKEIDIITRCLQICGLERI